MGGGGEGGIQVCMTNNDEGCITNHDKWRRNTYFLYQKYSESNIIQYIISIFQIDNDERELL